MIFSRCETRFQNIKLILYSIKSIRKNTQIHKMADTSTTVSAPPEPKFYKTFPEFTVKGCTFQYVLINNYDDTPRLRYLRGYTVDATTKCGNPWNLVEDILDAREEVLSYKPTKESLPDYPEKPTITVDFSGKAECIKDISENVGADCWLVYTTNDVRELSKIYYDAIRNKEDFDDANRTALMDNTAEVIGPELEEGKTVYVIMNKFFIDFVYKRVPGTDVYSRTTVHYRFKQNYPFENIE